MNRPPLVLAAVAALIGGAGVLLAAAAEHGGGAGSRGRRRCFSILHACAALAVAAHARVARLRAALVVGFAMEAGAALFAADLATRAFTGHRLFPFAAPVGGSMMIASWLALAAVFAKSALAR